MDTMILFFQPTLGWPGGGVGLGHLECASLKVSCSILPGADVGGLV